MDIGSILNQVLGAGQQMSQSQGGLNNVLGGLMGGNNSGGLMGGLSSLLSDTDTLKKVGGGAAAAGILSMLLGGGSKGLSRSIAKMGSLAAIGALAYKAYQSWQANHPAQAAGSTAILPSAQRTPAEVEKNSRVVLKAMIAAAASDGEISAAEQAAIIDQVGKESSGAQSWLQQIVQNPPSTAAIAADVGGDTALASEVYLASRIVCGDLDRKEIVYLSNLQQALGLSDELVEHLEKQAGF